MSFFRVILKTNMPCLIETPPMLDSILAWCAVQEAKGDFSAGESLPLVEREKDGCKYWAASRFFWNYKPASDMILRKSTQQNRLAKYSDAKGRVNEASGPLKTFFNKLKTEWIPVAVAYGEGDIDEVDYLLTKHLSHFGKGSRNGMGRVCSIEVEEIKVDNTEIIDGIQVRNLPDANGVLVPLRPPYWKKENFKNGKRMGLTMPDTVKEDLFSLV